MYEKILVPENDMQEAWEMIGRIEAVKAYIETDNYPDTKTIYKMLGGDIDYFNSVKQGM